MRDYRLTRAADRDLLEIAGFTLKTWDESQTDRYFAGLHDLLQKLARAPRLGRPLGGVRPGYFRRRYRSHVIFYKETAAGILVVRVLHAKMDFLRHL